MTSTPTVDRRTRRPRPTGSKKTPVNRVARTYAPGDLKNPALYINREMSWLAFKVRVLAQARDERHPLLERVKFLAIVGSNLDEFFMIRVATTVKKLKAGLDDLDRQCTDEAAACSRAGRQAGVGSRDLLRVPVQ